MFGGFIRITSSLYVRKSETGKITYPFLVRESVSVVKYLEVFPLDELEGALENIIAFDRCDGAVLRKLVDFCAKQGVKVAPNYNEGGKAFANSEKGIQGGISTPKTRPSSFKHGRIDEDGNPHVGGNT